jgi:sulfonate transport system substrate-binding protein
LMATGKYKVLFNGADAYGGKPTQAVFLAARQSFLDQNRDALKDFFEDHVRAVRWFQDPANRDEALKIVAKFIDAKPESLPDLFTKQDTYRDPWVMPNVVGIQLVIDAAAKLEMVPRRIEVSPKYVDLSFVQEAKRRIEKDGAAK